MMGDKTNDRVEIKITTIGRKQTKIQTHVDFLLKNGATDPVMRCSLTTVVMVDDTQIGLIRWRVPTLPPC